MGYQSKTTMVNVAVGYDLEKTPCSVDARYYALHAITAFIAMQCEMDIMSVSPYSLPTRKEEDYATVIYVNNGRTLDDIRRIMKPFEGKETTVDWMIQEICKYDGYLDCIALIRANNETWD